MAEFVFTSVSGHIPQAFAADRFGFLQDLIGQWKGTGFNQIWRPFRAQPGGSYGQSNSGQDRFLELNETIETIEFKEILGDIPNRGFLQGDINLQGMTYTQAVFDANVIVNGQPAGIHIEPGLWLNIPATQNPSNAPTVARLATIPHGTSIVMQGDGLQFGGPPSFAVANIAPFPIGQPGHPLPPNDFPEMNLSIPSPFRTPSQDIPHVTQAWLNNPNVVLQNGLTQGSVINTVTLKISTKPVNPPSTGGGASNIAFLQGASGGPNADTTQVEAIFWIETVRRHDGTTTLQLQYTQTVILDFNGLSWPHVSVATLQKL